MALSDEIDEQIISGSGVAPNISGLIHQLTAVAAGVRRKRRSMTSWPWCRIGSTELWATGTPDVTDGSATPRRTGSPPRRVRGTADERRARRHRVDVPEGNLGAVLHQRPDAREGQPTWTSTIAYLMGRTGLRTGVSADSGAPSASTDIYTDSRSGQRHFTVHALVAATRCCSCNPTLTPRSRSTTSARRARRVEPAHDGTAARAVGGPRTPPRPPTPPAALADFAFTADGQARTDAGRYDDLRRCRDRRRADASRASGGPAGRSGNQPVRNRVRG